MFNDSKKIMIRNLLSTHHCVSITFEENDSGDDRDTVHVGGLTQDLWLEAQGLLRLSGFECTGDVVNHTQLTILMCDTVPNSPLQDSPFNQGQRWHCKGDSKNGPSYTFVIIGKGHGHSYKWCRLEGDNPVLFPLHGMAEEYSHSYMQAHATLVLQTEKLES